MRSDSQRRQTDQAEQDRRDSLLQSDGDAAGAGDRRRLQLRGGSDCLQSSRLCLLWVECQLALVEGVEVEGLAAGERGGVCLRREVATDDEGVADVDGRADHHQQCERKQQAGNQDRAALALESARVRYSWCSLCVGVEASVLVDGCSCSAVDADRSEPPEERQSAERHLDGGLSGESGAALQFAFEGER